MKGAMTKRKIFDAVDLLTEEPAVHEEKADGVVLIKIDQIRPFHDHPFQLYEGERLTDMMNSIKENGILNPVIVLQVDDSYERQIPVDKSQWIIVKNTHEAIVSEETFEKARLSMSKKGNHSIGSAVRKDSRCVLFCPYCGLRLCKLPDRSKYYCRTRSNNPGMEKCRDVSIDLKKIEATLVEMVRQKAHIIENVEERMKKNAKIDSDDSAESITKELDRIGEKRAGFYMDYKNGKITKEEFIQYKDELEKQKAELNQRILQLQARDLETGETDSKLEQAMEIKEYRDLSVYDDKIMAKLFDRVDVYGEDRIEVRWKFQDIFDVLEHDMN